MANGKMSWGTCNVLAVLAAVGLLAAGCSGGGSGKGTAGTADAGPDASAPVKPENRYKVIADTASFFRFSPQQPGGPDLQVKKETRVTLINRFAGYRKVKLPAGDIGYVDGSEVAQLSPKEIADEDALAAARLAPPTALGPLNNANIGNGGNYNPPPEAGRAEPLPVADPNPTASPPPPAMFRY